MRIVQLANFYGPGSAGLRTALHHLGSGYAGRGSRPEQRQELIASARAGPSPGR